MESRGYWPSLLQDFPRRLREHPRRVRARVRSGIPDRFRGGAWMAMTGAAARQALNPGVFTTLAAAEAPLEKKIRLDISRTYPQHQLFRDPAWCGVGQKRLLHVLAAISVHCPAVGYCQGMGFIAAQLLCYMPEEEAFWTLVALIEDPLYAMAGIFQPGLPRIPLRCFQLERLMAKEAPELRAHLELTCAGLWPWIVKWFMTLWCNSFEMRTVVRIWDCFLLEGWTFLMRVALALHTIAEPHVIGLDVEFIVQFFDRRLPQMVNIDALIDAASAIDVGADELAALERDFLLKEEKRE